MTLSETPDHQKPSAEVFGGFYNRDGTVTAEGIKNMLAARIEKINEDFDRRIVNETRRLGEKYDLSSKIVDVHHPEIKESYEKERKTLIENVNKMKIQAMWKEQEAAQKALQALVILEMERDRAYKEKIKEVQEKIKAIEEKVEKKNDHEFEEKRQRMLGERSVEKLGEGFGLYTVNDFDAMKQMSDRMDEFLKDPKTSLPTHEQLERALRIETNLIEHKYSKMQVASPEFVRAQESDKSDLGHQLKLNALERIYRSLETRLWKLQQMKDKVSGTNVKMNNKDLTLRISEDGKWHPAAEVIVKGNDRDINKREFRVLNGEVFFREDDQDPHTGKVIKVIFRYNPNKGNWVEDLGISDF